jgi:hypothetical protein
LADFFVKQKSRGLSRGIIIAEKFVRIFFVSQKKIAKIFSDPNDSRTDVGGGNEKQSRILVTSGKE